MYVFNWCPTVVYRLHVIFCLQFRLLVTRQPAICTYLKHETRTCAKNRVNKSLSLLLYKSLYKIEAILLQLRIIRLEFLIDIIHNIPIHLTITNAFQGRFNGTQCSDTNGYKVSQINQFLQIIVQGVPFNDSLG